MSNRQTPFFFLENRQNENFCLTYFSKLKNFQESDMTFRWVLMCHALDFLDQRGSSGHLLLEKLKVVCYVGITIFIFQLWIKKINVVIEDTYILWNYLSCTQDASFLMKKGQTHCHPEYLSLFHQVEIKLFDCFYFLL